MSDLDNGRARYAALVEIVHEQITSGKVPKTAWLDEIIQTEVMHPEWVATPAPPPPSAQILVPVIKAAAPEHPGERLIIRIDEDMERVVKEVLITWGKRLAVFQAGGKLLEVQTDASKDIEFLISPPGSARMVVVGSARARALAARECAFGQDKIAKDGSQILQPCLPPEWLGPSIVTRPDFPNIPPFTALAQSPTLRSDGGLVHESGYDASTGIYLASNIQVNVPETPTYEDVRASVRRLLDLVSDFDFVNAGKSVWLAGLLSVICRHTFDGPAPAIIVDASKRGSGKTTLVDLVSIIATGAKAPRMVYTHDEVEMDKRISSLALAGEQLVLIDNVVGKFDSSSINAALTSDCYRGRALGRLEMTPSVPMKIVWFATGNGMVVGADTARRSLFIRLEPQTDYPEDRMGPRPGEPWKYPNLTAHVKANRAQYLTDVLIIGRAYIQAGRPRQNLTPMGSFMEWSDSIRSTLVWAGAGDPCETVKDARGADLDDHALRGMVACWPVACEVKVTAANLIEWAETQSPMSADQPTRTRFESERTAREMWRNALLEWLPAKKGDLPTARELGYALRSIKGSIIGNFKIEAGEPLESGIPWLLIRVSGKTPESGENKDRSLLSVVK